MGEAYGSAASTPNNGSSDRLCELSLQKNSPECWKLADSTAHCMTVMQRRVSMGNIGYLFTEQAVWGLRGCDAESPPSGALPCADR